MSSKGAAGSSTDMRMPDSASHMIKSLNAAFIGDYEQAAMEGGAMVAAAWKEAYSTPDGAILTTMSILLPFALEGAAAKSATQVVRTTRTGERAVRITRADGSVVDISPQRVKEYVPNTHPNAPPGTLDRVRFPDAQPGSKGLKRDPTADELEILRNPP
jgi:hypothetical protein